MKMKRSLLLLPILWCSLATAQVKIGDNPQNIGPASLLELESTDRVLVITRVTTAQMEAITPSRGGLVYNTEEDCLFYHNGQRWINLCEALGLSFTAEAIVNEFPTIAITRLGDTVNFEVGQIRGSNIVDFSISGQDIQDNVISQSKLANASVGTDELQDNAVTAAKIGGDVAGTGLIQNAAGALEVDVTAISGNGDIVSEDLVVGGAPDALFAEVTLEIAPGAVGTPELADDAVTSEKIAEGQVATEDLADDAVTPEKLDSSVAGAGLVQNVAGALEVDVTGVEGDGTLSSPDATLTVGGAPANALFADVELVVNIPGLISGNNGNALATGTDGGLFATDDQTAGEVSYNDSATALGAGTAQEAIEILAAGVAADLDTDPANEFALTGSGPPGITGTSAGQTYVDLDSGQLYVWDGTAPWVPVGGSNAADNDPDPQNELQDLEFIGGVISLTGDPTPTQIDLSGYDTNAADDFDGNWVSLNGIPPGFADNVDDNTQLSEAEVDAFVANNGFLTVEADGDDTNELVQEFEIQGLNLVLTDAGNSYQIPIAGFGTDDQTAGEVGLTPTGNLQSIDVQNALEELQGDIDLLNATPGANLSTSNLQQPFQIDRTYDINDGNLIFIGPGNVGIGNGANPPANKFHVAGAIRSQGILNSSGTNPGEPSYRFSNDTNTGFWNPAADQLELVTAGQSTLLLRESGAQGLEIIANGSVELTEQLIDETGNAGNPGEVLVATATGTQWTQPNVKVWGKIANALPVKSSGIASVANPSTGRYIILFDNPFADANYTVQLSVVGNHRIYVEVQNNNSLEIEIRDEAGVLSNADFFVTIID